ncbi:YbaN family protein [Cupriavidus sp. 2TAF22]|uniref:YbaN family protein n=1 Tax=unclassified Cupriavidus TaxID=2640874 RepID=UPI003F8F7873
MDDADAACARDAVPPTRAAAAEASQDTPLRLARTRTARALLTALALLSLGVAILGLFVPGLPSTEFVLLSAWAAAKGSPRLHAWLLGHRVFGPMLYNWHHGRMVSRRAKWSATAAMTVCAGVLLFGMHRPWLAYGAIACMACVLAWLWCRPEPPG